MKLLLDLTAMNTWTN